MLFQVSKRRKVQSRSNKKVTSLFINTSPFFYSTNFVKTYFTVVQLKTDLKRLSLSYVRATVDREFRAWITKKKTRVRAKQSLHWLQNRKNLTKLINQH